MSARGKTMSKTTAEILVPLHVWVRVKLETDPMTEYELEDYINDNLKESILLEDYRTSVGIRIAGSEVGTEMFTSAEVEPLDSYTLGAGEWELYKSDGIKEEEE